MQICLEIRVLLDIFRRPLQLTSHDVTSWLTRGEAGGRNRSDLVSVRFLLKSAVASSGEPLDE
jgi:hypothetical protein